MEAKEAWEAGRAAREAAREAREAREAIIAAGYNEAAARPHVEDAMSNYGGDEHDFSTFYFELVDGEELIITFGGYINYGAWEIEDDHAGFYAALKPVGGLTPEGLHADYELVGHGQS
jgi:hypothetical protein